MADELKTSESRARTAVARFEEALDRQWDAAVVPSWPHAPKHIREAYGDPSVPDPPSSEAFEAWLTWLERRSNSLAQSQENLERGRIATRNDPARSELYWKRALITSERALGELDGSPEFVGGARVARRAAGKSASSLPGTYNASLAWTVVAYGATGLGTLVVLGVGGFMAGEHVGSLVLLQIGWLVIGFLPALAVMHRLLESLARRAAKSGKGPESTEAVSVVLPFVPPIGFAVLTWLIVTSP